MDQTIESAVEEKYAILTTAVRDNQRWLLLLGVLMVLLGVAAILFPFVASLAMNMLIGWVLLFSGTLGILHAFRMRKWAGFFISLLGALLSLGLGSVLLLYPVTGIVSLTLLMAAFLFAGGLLRILLALRLRPFDHWVWLLFSGVLALVLAALILTQWSEAVWILGILVGIDLVFAGWTMLLLAVTGRRTP